MAAYLAPFADTLPPGALEGYALPQSDGTKRNRKNLRKAMDLLSEAGWTVEGGVLRNARGDPLNLSVLLRQGDSEMKTVIEIYARALERLGVSLTPELVDNAQYVGRQSEFDFDLTRVRRELSLSPRQRAKAILGRPGRQSARQP